MAGNRFDVIIVGAGIVGLSSAYHIKKNNPDMEVLVIDRANTYAQGNTAKSAASIRDLFSEEVNFKLSHSTIEFYKYLNSHGNDIGLSMVGYLFLLRSGDRRTHILRKLASKTKIRFFEDGEIATFPGLRAHPDSELVNLMGLSNVDEAVLGENCGTVEPELISQYYFEESKKLGVEFMFRTELSEFTLAPVKKIDFPGEPFLWQDKIIGDLQTNRGTLHADTYVCATDVWATKLLDNTGIDSHIRPKKRQIFQLSGPAVEKILYGWKYNEQHVIPFTILPFRAAYLRPAPKFKSIWVGVADDFNRNFDLEEDPQPERDFFEKSLMQIISAYYPDLSDAKLTGSWAGYYSYNTIDKSPYIFRDLNLIVATGTSGSGILKGDGIGRNVEAILSGKNEVKLFDGTSYITEQTGLYKRTTLNEEIVL